MLGAMNPSEDLNRLRREAEQWWLRLRDRDATRGDAEAMKQWRARSPLHAQAWDEVAPVSYTHLTLPTNREV